jgi:hypothetical protein
VTVKKKRNSVKKEKYRISLDIHIHDDVKTSKYEKFMCKNENDRSKIIEHFSKYISQSLAQYNELVEFAKDQRVANLWNNISSNVIQDICGLTASINEGTLDLERKHHSRGYPNTTTSSSFPRSHQSHFSDPEKGPKSSGKLDHLKCAPSSRPRS